MRAGLLVALLLAAAPHPIASFHGLAPLARRKYMSVPCGGGGRAHRSMSLVSMASTFKRMEPPLQRPPPLRIQEESDDEEDDWVSPRTPPKIVNRYSTRDWFDNLLTTFRAPSMRRIAPHLIVNIAVAACIAVAFFYFPQATFWHHVTNEIPHLLMGSALGLLLVFRTNTAYDRYWEACKIWNDAMSRLRMLAAQAHRSMSGLDREHLLRLLVAMPAVLVLHLRQSSTDEDREHVQTNMLSTFVGEDNAKMLWKSHNRPLLLCKMIAAIIHKHTDPVALTNNMHEECKDLTPLELNCWNNRMFMQSSELLSQRATADTQISGLVDCISACERIVETTVPVSYSRHCSRFLSVWCFTLPLVLVRKLGPFAMVPCVAGMVWALLTIEEVSHLIEDPFNIPTRMGDNMRLEHSFRFIRDNLLERMPSVSEPIQSMAFSGLDHDIDDYDVLDFHNAFIQQYRQGKISNQETEV